ncbi:MAG: hypothetical protein JXA25_17965, partial [Anaerolineales bacterium]|nr:hypothetical protein [Anaerolineales bacterium]
IRGTGRFQGIYPGNNPVQLMGTFFENPFVPAPIDLIRGPGRFQGIYPGNNPVQLMGTFFENPFEPAPNDLIRHNPQFLLGLIYPYLQGLLPYML